MNSRVVKPVSRAANKPKIVKRIQKPPITPTAPKNNNETKDDYLGIVPRTLSTKEKNSFFDDFPAPKKPVTLYLFFFAL